ncbi:dethiobiotin synthase [Chitinimonas sp. BJYL2]|uniref:dethiobiotin synthase n=1 Tax=Chitinimonas sp. BJYL2 TaxID=2976696 RepID=UPI0022B54442|nr:dethiobiotin synthase [Chitinimonas sp. BJYL2]
MSAYFVTGTDTEVGKTHVTCRLLRAAVQQGWRAVGMKPVAAGGVLGADGYVDNEDVLAHRAAGNVIAPRAEVNPYAFPDPVSPHLAARKAGVVVEVERIVTACRALQARADLVLVEGAGGWLAPLDEQHTMADLARALGLPVILVVGVRLGCLNHALLTADAVRRSGLPLAGWVANCVDPAMAMQEENIQYLSRHLSCEMLMRVPYCVAGQKAESNQDPEALERLRALVRKH